MTRPGGTFAVTSAAAPIFDRIAGVETEYAIRYRPDSERVPRPPDVRLYEATISELRRKVSILPAHHVKRGVFLQNGGAVWYEKAPYRANGPIEGATPECRGPC